MTAERRVVSLPDEDVRKARMIAGILGMTMQKFFESITHDIIEEMYQNIVVGHRRRVAQLAIATALAEEEAKKEREAAEEAIAESLKEAKFNESEERARREAEEALRMNSPTK